MLIARSMQRGPKYTWRHGIAALLAAAAFYWVGSGHWFGRVSSANMMLSYVVATGFAIMGAFMIAQDLGGPH